MSAPTGNQFWKMRTKHGRDKIFTDSETMLQSAYEYFKWNSENPWYKYEAVKSGELAGEIIPIPTARPLTIYGLTQFWGVTAKYLENFEKALKPEEEDFLRVITHIREIISRQKFEGASVGVFNATIISRDLGLVDKKDMTTGGESMNKGFADFLQAVNTVSE